MDANLREQFDRAVSDDPGADVSEMARVAIAEGGQVRRRRRTAMAGMAAGVAVALGVGTVFGLSARQPETAAPPITIAAAMLPQVAPACRAQAEEADATDAAIFGTLSEPQRTSLRAALDADPRVKSLTYESNQEAYERFKALWEDSSPEFVASLSTESFPESFRVRLTDRSRFPAFQADYRRKPGVLDIVGHVCPPSAPVGGVQ
ncbi:hypothetical protein JIG36_05115 [Actinoplanes sp. LDG1-06]|uniref:FtsX extracellular domain-containing protein n=1 Tax=Paractinoplanes ovalisporus TaxID=2810368 RepID=A0ABS2A520_9ACTN|nr:permease-like cell division protein FtsX [Actinoplanes ovalisporus]MBM2614938.1 hypothetical protein [Actinoplanes ovalisporus]